ncbi:hypothetical protein AWC38_SpisGene22729 [Stylophora pistillata]|uniref:EGF-like domain-containing protein n=2 Tax=Stylophora pistillata TaxID=50429 RepID=A0A2B4R8Q9_STYPI|nr:hypothetical protein AWC38_SpisGene22729 [Stylophora pistillata]
MHTATELYILFVFFTLRANLSCSSGENNLQDSFNGRLFSKTEYRYLDVPHFAATRVHDELECVFRCLRSHRCLSANMATSKEADEQFWCELLSSGKGRNVMEFKENKSSHHFSIMSTCPSSRCHNRGTCLITEIGNDAFECLCEEGFIGKNCSIAAKSCKELGTAYNSNLNRVVTLHFDSKATPIFCHFGDFGCGDGVWTPVMKIDGSKSTFHYSSSYWSDKITYNVQGGKTAFDSHETKLPTYWNTPFSKICLGMKIGQQINFITIERQASSLYSLIADGQYRNTSLGREKWKSLIGSQASLQYYCNIEGFNPVCSWSSASKARIGILSNNEDLCSSCDARIGFGTGGKPDDSNTCGNSAVYLTDNGDKQIKAIGYILVQ